MRHLDFIHLRWITLCSLGIVIRILGWLYLIVSVSLHIHILLHLTIWVLEIWLINSRKLIWCGCSRQISDLELSIKSIICLFSNKFDWNILIDLNIIIFTRKCLIGSNLIVLRTSLIEITRRVKITILLFFFLELKLIYTFDLKVDFRWVHLIDVCEVIRLQLFLHMVNKLFNCSRISRITHVVFLWHF